MPLHTSTLNPSSPEGSGSLERRACVRRLCNRKAVARLGDGMEVAPLVEEEATVRNLSATGVGLLLKGELPLNTILLVEPAKEGIDKPVLIARVLHARTQAGGWYHGCELGHHLNPDELEKWLF